MSQTTTAPANLAHTDNTMAFAYALNCAKVDRLADAAFPDRKRGSDSETPGDAMPAAMARLRLLTRYPSTTDVSNPDKLNKLLNSEHHPLAFHVTMPRPAPTPAAIAQAFAAMDQHPDEMQAGLQQVSDTLEFLQAPTQLITAKDRKRQEIGLTKSQIQYQRQKRSHRMAMGFFKFSAKFPNNRQAERFLAAMSWPEGPACPYCGAAEISLHANKPGDTFKPITWACNACNNEFGVATNTVMAEPDLPAADWIHLAWRMLHDRSGMLLDPEYLADVAGDYHGFEVQASEAKEMYRKIQDILPHAKPRMLQPCHHQESIKMLARGIRPASLTGHFPR